jgi:hypothetical protein
MFYDEGPYPPKNVPLYVPLGWTFELLEPGVHLVFERM